MKGKGNTYCESTKESLVKGRNSRPGGNMLRGTGVSSGH